MARCTQCDAVSVEQVPSDAYLKRLYDPKTYASSLVSSQRLSERCAQHILLNVPEPTGDCFRILDYGGNDGSLSRALAKQLAASGYAGRVEATIVDLFPRDDESGLRFITPEQFVADDTRYDLLLASAVLEHLARPYDALKTIMQAAKPGAMFYARTPYDLPLAKLHSGLGMKWPRHFHDMGPGYWNHAEQWLQGFDAMHRSQPSVVETDWSQSWARTLAAKVLKFPCHVETRSLMRLFGYRVPLWRLVGGWEVFIQCSGRAG